MRRPLLFGCICLFVLIALWTKIKHPLPRSSNAAWEGSVVTLVGQVYQKEYRVSYGEEKFLLYLDSVSILAEEGSPPIQADNIPDNFICEITQTELQQAGFQPSLGSHIVIEGTLQSFLHATNEGEFDAANYYAIEGIGGRVKNVTILRMDNQRWWIRDALYGLRQRLLHNLYLAFPEKEASLLAKMLLGDGSGLNKEIKDLYQSNGIVHILSISGLHITMLGMGFYRGLRRLTIPIIPAALAGGIVIFLYGVMTGFSVSACRAVGMYLIHMLGEIWGRTYDMLTAMGVLAIVMLLDNPLLSYHSGFLLSFSSVCGVGLLVPVLSPTGSFFTRKPWDNGCKKVGKGLLERTLSGFITSLSVTLFTLPIQLYFFYQIPIYSVFINLLVIPFMSVVMGVGIAAMLFPILSFLSPVEVGIFSWFEWLCHVFEELPGHTLLVGRPAIWQIMLYYGFLLLVICMRRKGRLWVFFCWISVAVVILLLRAPIETQIFCLDVGQGDCFVIRTRENKVFLLDGGSSSRENAGEKVIKPFLKYYGIRKLDGVFLSHGDQDHVNGILQLLEDGSVEIETIYVPDVQEANLAELEEKVKSIGDLQVVRVQKGDMWRGEDFYLECLHPSKGFVGESNETSACYLFEVQGLSMLFTGDVCGEGEECLVKELKRQHITQVDVLKVAHHGSVNGTSEAFLQQISPKVAVISCGRNNLYGHPHAETLKRLEDVGCAVWTTPNKGRIAINVGKGTIDGYAEAEKE